MTSIMVSESPETVEKIKSGEKTILAKKFKLSTPFKVYLYETKAKHLKKGRLNHSNGKYVYNEEFGRGKVVAEFIVNTVKRIGNDTIIEYSGDLEEVCYRCLEYEDICKKVCLDYQEMYIYSANWKDLYALHISDLKVYDKPKELGQFTNIPKEFRIDIESDELCGFCPCTDFGMNKVNTNQFNQCEGVNCQEAKRVYLEEWESITSAPKNFIYVEEL